MSRSKELIDKLVAELEKRNYNVKPGKLRQGCVTAFVQDPDGTYREPTEEEMDAIFEQAQRERDAR